LSSLRLDSDFERAKKSHKVSSGTARRRGRSSRVGVSTLVVVGRDSKIGSLSGSIPGVDVKAADEISVLDLVPGSKPVRLTLYSDNAIKYLSGKKTRINNVMQIASTGARA
jgi:large subunit ribosomal protein L4e